VLQYVAVCCSVLQCVVDVYNMILSFARRESFVCASLQCVAVCCSMLQCVAVYCSVLQCVVDMYNIILSFARHELFVCLHDSYMCVT